MTDISATKKKKKNQFDVYDDDDDDDVEKQSKTVYRMHYIDMLHI